MSSPRKDAMKRSTQRSGFSLVEVSLALLVVGVGIMGVFALFPSGLDSARLSQEETRAALFANDTFDTWRTLFRSGIPMTDLLSIRPASPGNDFWEDGENTVPRVTDTDWANANGLTTVSYVGSVRNERYAPSWRFDLDKNIPEYTLRYRFVIADHPDHFRVKRAKLLVWPGEFGPTTTNTAHMFYTEFYQ